MVDEYHGQKLEDPYRYMENLEDKRVINWMKENASYAESVVRQVPGRQGIKERLINIFMKEGDYITNTNISGDGIYFYVNQKAGEDYGKLYKRSCFSCEEEMLYDPINFNSSADENYIIYEIRPNYKGNLISVAFAPNGSENTYVQIIDDKGNHVGETIALARSVSWLPSDDAFTYTQTNSSDVTEMDRYKDLNVYLHKLGSSHSDDKIILSRKNNPNLDFLPEEIPTARFDADANIFLGYARNDYKPSVSLSSTKKS